MNFIVINIVAEEFTLFKSIKKISSDQEGEFVIDDVRYFLKNKNINYRDNKL